MNAKLPIPPHYSPEKVSEVWRVEYGKIAKSAREWAKAHEITPASSDDKKVCLLLIDVQNTFCIPGFELFVGGRSGTGAVDDNRRLCEFIYRNLGKITRIIPTLDTHQAMQIFHPSALSDKFGNHPEPFTVISREDAENEVWQFAEEFSHTLNIDSTYLKRYISYYTKQIEKIGKYNLTVWPYHAMLGGIGHALVSSVEEAIFFHSIARYSQPSFQMKGFAPLTEYYSALSPEVSADWDGTPIADINRNLIDSLLQYDALIIAGQAKSHCVAWTVQDLLMEIGLREKRIAEKVHILTDCTSPVVVSGVIDFTDDAERAFNRFAEAGVKIIRSTDDGLLKI